jgi:hypothetical protein
MTGIPRTAAAPVRDRASSSICRLRAPPRRLCAPTQGFAIRAKSPRRASPCFGSLAAGPRDRPTASVRTTACVRARAAAKPRHSPSPGCCEFRVYIYGICHRVNSNRALGRHDPSQIRRHRGTAGSACRSLFTSLKVLSGSPFGGRGGDDAPEDRLIGDAVIGVDADSAPPWQTLGRAELDQTGPRKSSGPRRKNSSIAPSPSRRFETFAPSALNEEVRPFPDLQSSVLNRNSHSAGLADGVRRAPRQRFGV